MGPLKLELRSPQKVDTIAADPEPDWSFDALVSELNALEIKLGNSPMFSVPFTKSIPRGSPGTKNVERSRKIFAMRAPEFDHEVENSEKDNEKDKGLVHGKRFTCDEIYLSESDDSDDKSAIGEQSYLMDETELVEGAFFEITNKYQLGIKEEIRNQISAFETDLMNEHEKSISAFSRVDKYKEVREDFDRKLDAQYQRRIAEALDDHLTAVQRDREVRSEIVERKIESDRAYEEARRKEKALQEEKIRQEKANAEAEAKLRAEEAKRAALEAERRAAAEAVARKAAEAAAREAAEAAKSVSAGGTKEESGQCHTDASLSKLKSETKKSDSDIKKKSPPVRATESAINLERMRLQKLMEVYEKNKAITLSSNKDFSGYERHIARSIRQIRAIKENVRSKANELVRLLSDPQYPSSIGIAIFAKKVVSHCESPDSAAAFAIAYVIVLVTSQVAGAMDLLLAEFHRACIYTVPKHLVYSESSFKSKDAYFTSLGFREDGGKIESADNYLKRLESYMKLFAALVQTDIPGYRNMHGLEEAWAWLARFLNAIPANKYTVVALNAFLQMAGFALYGRYKFQFIKILNVIYDDFLAALKAREEPELRAVIAEITFYIENKKFLEEPEGRSLQSSLISHQRAIY